MGGLTAEAMGEKMAEQDSPWTDHFQTKDAYGRPEVNEFLGMLGAELQGAQGILVANPEASRFNDEREQVAGILRRMASRGLDLNAVGRPTLRRMVEEALSSEFEQPAAGAPRVHSLPELRAAAARMPAQEFLAAYGGEWFGDNTPADVIHDYLEPSQLDPNEWDEWEDVAAHETSGPKSAAMREAAASRALPPVLVRGLPTDPKYRPQVLDGHHRTAAALQAGATIPVIYNTDTLAELWVQANGRQAGGQVVTGGEARAIADEFRASAAAPKSLPQTDSLAFRTWFGDSKVVDAQGQPQVVYHGTGAQFDTFMHTSGSTTGHASAAFGHYFTTDRGVAESYADQAAANADADDGVVVEAYLSIRNPYTMTEEEWRAAADHSEGLAIRDWIQAQGFDGIHIADADFWVAFKPTQIKSATGNSGAFSASNPSIFFQPEAPQTETPAFRQWFGESEVIEDGQPKVVYHGTPLSFDEFEGNDQVEGWFAESPATADRYANNENRFGGDFAPQVYPVYLSIQNPAHLPFDMNDPITAVWDTAREVGIENPEAVWPKPAPGVNKGAWEAVRSDQFIEALKAHGFDGIRVREKGAWTWGVFKPTQVKSATGNSGAFDSGNPSILFQERPFFSGLLAAIDAAKQTKASGAQWLGWLANQGGLKKEEIEYYDLPAWLSGQKSVTKEALADYLRANELVMEETVLGQDARAFDPDSLDDLPFIATSQRGSAPFRVIGPHGDMGTFASADEAERAAYDFSTGYVRSQGGQLPTLNSSEFVVARIDAEDVEPYGLDDDLVGQWALFEKDRDSDTAKGEFMGQLPRGVSYARALYAAVTDIIGCKRGRHRDPSGHVRPAGQPGPYANMTLPGGKNYKVMLLRLPTTLQDRTLYRVVDARGNMLLENIDGGRERAERMLAREIEEGNAGASLVEYAGRPLPGADAYTDGHWRDHPNTVAHVRFDERTDADGKRVLFVQELQSDWHQQGRKKGYKGVLRAEYPSTEAMLEQVGWKARPATQAETPSYGLANADGYTHLTYGDGSVALYHNDDMAAAVRKRVGGPAAAPVLQRQGRHARRRVGCAGEAGGGPVGGRLAGHRGSRRALQDLLARAGA